jgi:carboxypeptidase Taq
METGLVALRDWWGGIEDLQRALAVLDWDRSTFMPAGGAEQRTEQLGTLERLAHDRLTSDRTGELLAGAEAELGGAAPDSIDARLVSEARRLYEKQRQVPVELAVARTKAASDGYKIWVAARAEDDFSAFRSALERNFELTRDYSECFDSYDDPYDAVLEDFAPDMRTAHVATLLGEMRDRLTPLVMALRGREIDVAPLHVRYPVTGQRQLVDRVLRWMGFTDDSWRLDDTVHPFESSFSVTDVRLTTRYAEDYFPTGLYGAMHECGHGLYEAGISPSLQRTPLGSIRSSAVHESQSRLWENVVGRSRAFAQALTPAVAELSGGALKGLDPDTLFRAVNAVRPSLIRIEADETTYGLHIALRFELERSLLAGELDVADLPEAWRERMRSYLGVKVPSDADGVMQDVHWSAGLVGYFPTYAIGNLIAAQLWEALRVDIPDVDVQLAAGRLQEIREWLRERVHRHGSRYTDTELLTQVVGGPVQVTPLIDHLQAKLTEVYGVAFA